MSLFIMHIRQIHQIKTDIVHVYKISYIVYKICDIGYKIFILYLI